MKIPVLGAEINAPSGGSLATYAGLGAATLVGVVEWPITAAVVAGHLIGKHTTLPGAGAND